MATDKIPPAKPSDDKAKPSGESGFSAKELEQRARVKAAREKVETAKAAEKAAAAKKPDFVVAKGKSLTTGRGVVSEGQAVSPLDLVRDRSMADEGMERIEELCAKGYVVDQRKAK